MSESVPAVPPVELHGPAPQEAAARVGLQPVGRRPGWWVAPVYLALALVLVPWIVVLAVTLPMVSTAQHYRLSWVGFDVLLAVALVRTAWMALRRSPFVVNTATAAATLLVVDAWFDVVTSSGADQLQAVLAAVFVELPLAAMSLVISVRAQREIARTGAVRQYRRWRRARMPHPSTRAPAPTPRS